MQNKKQISNGVNINIKKAFLQIFIGAIIIGGLFFVGLSPRGQKFSSNPDSVKNGEKKYFLTLNYGNGKIRKFSSEMAEEKTRAWNLLQLASAQSAVSVEIEDGFLPRSIDGFKNTDQNKWVLFVNGARQTNGPFEVFVKKGDLVEFKYEKQ
ncbi:MAG: hypothetical protein HYW71_00935 [Candidatus Niyogibacteria bacterium]|nr:hypothetical protein [Candidatus Niyogibacteria bacterium]